MLAKLLIANRGEIACRIIRTARRLGVRTVLAVSEADRRSMAATQADEIAILGPAPAADSYLSVPRVIEAARRSHCDAIHPGYGFLSENADFAQGVTDAGLIFVGPTAQAMRALGSKAAAKALAMTCGVPVVPGYQGPAQDAATLRVQAGRVGYPVLIKAVHGGGGRGMRLVEHDRDFPEALDSARREAIGAFGSDEVLIEKLVVAPRHIEVQVFGDQHGDVVHMFERDCTLQRRNQKVIEEAPAPGLTAELRACMTNAAVRLARSVGYQNAGTVEFLVQGADLPDARFAGASVDGSPPARPGQPDARWYFIEMNTRLQVEHPVTEAITGLDLVEWQLRVASGEPLPLQQDAITISGHAIEARLNAEDPANGFLPSIGRIVAFEPPAADQNLRIETGVTAGSEVTPFYDSMIAKLIAYGPDRPTAIARLTGMIEATKLAGPRTNARFLRQLLGDDDVVQARLDTGLIARKLDQLTARPSRAHAVRTGIAALLDPCGHQPRSRSPWDARDAFQLGGARHLQMAFAIDGETSLADITWQPNGPVVSWSDAGQPDCPSPRVIDCHHDAGRVLVVADLAQTEIAWPVYDATSDDVATGNSIRAPINGRVAKLFVAAGDAVDKGTRIAVIEAMKMEHVLVAPRAGVIAALSVHEGAQVTAGAAIAALAEQ